jgi:hypothetical protein
MKGREKLEVGIRSVKAKKSQEEEIIYIGRQRGRDVQMKRDT